MDSFIKKPRKSRPGDVKWENYLDTHYLRKDRIGEIITFIRFGATPENGKSKWMRTTSKYGSFIELGGVSVLECKNIGDIPESVEMYLDIIKERPILWGKGEILGWGTDGEPLIKVINIERIDENDI